MASTAFVRARIDETLKDEAAAVLAGMGLTVSDVVRMTLTRVARDKAIPFDVNAPNANTQAAMQEARELMAAKKLRFANGEELINALDQKSS